MAAPSPNGIIPHSIRSPAPRPSWCSSCCQSPIVACYHATFTTRGGGGGWVCHLGFTHKRKIWAPSASVNARRTELETSLPIEFLQSWEIGFPVCDACLCHELGVFVLSHQSNEPQKNKAKKIISKYVVCFDCTGHKSQETEADILDKKGRCGCINSFIVMGFCFKEWLTL